MARQAPDGLHDAVVAALSSSDTPLTSVEIHENVTVDFSREQVAYALNVLAKKGAVSEAGKKRTARLWKLGGKRSKPQAAPAAATKAARPPKALKHEEATESRMPLRVTAHACGELLTALGREYQTAVDTGRLVAWTDAVTAVAILYGER